MKLDYLNTTVVLAAQLLNFQEANYLFFYFNSFQTHCWTSHSPSPHISEQAFEEAEYVLCATYSWVESENNLPKCQHSFHTHEDHGKKKLPVKWSLGHQL